MPDHIDRGDLSGSVYDLSGAQVRVRFFNNTRIQVLSCPIVTDENGFLKIDPSGIPVSDIVSEGRDVVEQKVLEGTGKELPAPAHTIVCSYCGDPWDYNHEIHGQPMEKEQYLKEMRY